MICFYHSADFDGHCSGAVVKHAHPDCLLYPINYGDEFPWELAIGETVVMVDFGLQPFGDMIRLKAVADELIWIDHHRTALNDYDLSDISRPWRGIRREGIGACALTWEYFFPAKEMPEAVRLLAEYDVWNHSDPNTLPFQYGMRLWKTDPKLTMEVWGRLFKDLDGELLVEILDSGKLILDYERRQNEIYANSCCFETTLDGHPCIAVNKILANSQVFDSVWDPQKYEFMLMFGWRKGAWRVSLYTTRNDMIAGDVARTHGGGGHPQAAGFECQALPFELPSE
jgi:hypothetical protein